VEGRIRRGDANEFRELGSEVVLAHGGHLLAMNRSGSRLWDLLKEPRTAEELTQTLAEEGSPAPDREVQGFLERLQELGLVGPVA
jgi:hypothetical protein